MAVYAVLVVILGLDEGLTTSGTMRDSGSNAWIKLNPMEFIIRLY